jgi:hypothetical protein
MKKRFVGSLLVALLACVPGQGAPGPNPQEAVQGTNASSAPRLVRAASGPSGKTIGDRFVFNEERRRFVIPNDKSMVVFMEWEGTPGEQKITGVWKRPDGQTAFLSSDIEMESEGTRFNAYWTFYLSVGMESGVWQLEATINGAPAGSYPFEVVAPAPVETVVEAKVAPKLPTLEDLYEQRKSLVWVHRLDELGHRLETMSGFVLSEGVVATSFQAIDIADGLELEFHDGRKELVSDVLAYNATDDWALLKVSTGLADPVATSESPTVSIGERLVAFNAEPQATRVIGGVDYTGRKASAKLERYVFNPALEQAAMGGPLLDTKGNVVGILSGCVAPGTRLGGASRFMGGFGSRLCARNTAVPIGAVMQGLRATPLKFQALKANGVIAQPVRKIPAFLHGGTQRADVAVRQKRILGRLALDDETEFNKVDSAVTVYSWWQHPEQTKGRPAIRIGASIYDAENQARLNVEPKSVKVSKGVPTEHTFAVPVAALDVGIYRIDVLADGVCVWRTFIQIRE